MSTRQSLVLLPGLLRTEFVWRDRLEVLEDLAETTVASAQRGHDSLYLHRRPATEATAIGRPRDTGTASNS